MKFKLTAILFTCFTAQVSAQEADTLRKRVSPVNVDKFPLRRNFDIQFEQFGQNDYNADFLENKKNAGHLKNNYRIKTGVLLPVYKTNKLNLSAALNYKYEVYDFDRFEKTGGFLEAAKTEYHTFSSAINFTSSTKFFNKRLIYSASIIADGSNKTFGRVKGNLLAIVNLKQTATTNFGVGLTGIIDASAQVPILPVIIYQHKFAKPGWSIDAIVPQRIYLRKEISKSSRLSLGSELQNELLYVNVNNYAMNTTYDYRQFEIKSGLVYEYNLGNNIIATTKAGIRNIVQTRATNKGEAAKDYVYDAKQDATWFFSLGFSYSPFK